VRGFTQHPSSGVSRSGTFAGDIEKIPYIKELGVNTVEVMPVWEFEEADSDRIDPFTGDRLLNYWGYHPIAFFSPNASYASRKGNGAQVREFKEMVKSLHAASIGVVLDTVFNHTAEGNERGPTYSFRGNNNAYCQDNKRSWVDWHLLEANADLFRFFRLLIQFRRAHPLLRREDYDLNEEGRSLHIAWYGTELGKPDWSRESRSLAMHLHGVDGGEMYDIYFIANAHWAGHTFELPHLSGHRWWRVVDTMQTPPQDIAEPGAEDVLVDQRRYGVGPRSVVVLTGK